MAVMLTTAKLGREAPVVPFSICMAEGSRSIRLPSASLMGFNSSSPMVIPHVVWLSVSRLGLAQTPNWPPPAVLVYQISVPKLTRAPNAPSPGPSASPGCRPRGSSCQMIAQPPFCVPLLTSWLASREPSEMRFTFQTPLTTSDPLASAA